MISSASPDRSHNVLVVTHYYGTHGGGIERVADKLVEEIGATDNIRFTWAASNTDAAPSHEGLSPLPMSTMNWIELLLGLPCPVWGPGSLKKLKQAIAEADVVWLHDTLYMGNILAFKWAQQMGKPVMITQHISLIPYRNPLMRFLMSFAERFFTHRMLKNATQTTFISDRVAEYFYKRIAFSKAVQIIPNGVDTHIYTPSAPAKRQWQREQFCLRKEQPLMLFVGRFVEKKGLSVIRELAKLLPTWRFWLAGKGPIKPKSWHLPNVHVFNDKQGENLAELYQIADLFLLPSFGEGFPLVIQESLAAGLPVMCSPETAAGSRQASPYLLQLDVFPGNPARTARLWAEKLQSMAGELPRQQPDQSLAAFADTAWSWPSIASAYADILRSLAKRALP